MFLRRRINRLLKTLQIVTEPNTLVARALYNEAMNCTKSLFAKDLNAYDLAQTETLISVYLKNIRYDPLGTINFQIFGKPYDVKLIINCSEKFSDGSSTSRGTLSIIRINHLSYKGCITQRWWGYDMGEANYDQGLVVGPQD